MQLIIFMGIQASGKSSYYLLNLAHSHLRINLDMLKTRHREKIIFEAGLASKTKMVIDNTNPTPADRARYIASAQAAGFEIVGYFFETELKGALERNHLREGKACIPEVGIRATAQKLEPPHYAEGFDALYKVRILGQGEFSISPIQI
ncbi:AAA family ATPase [Acinetobacter sp. MYb177]|uniref:AAA family ATPase n=1 Tax=unclassified Acinetobacter TaxID=196816 RepID=UPI0030AB1B6C